MGTDNMGWWPSILGGSSSADPVQNLDPKLREFLEKESPVRYQQTPAQAQPSSQPVQHPTVSKAVAESQQKGDADAKSKVPAESLYQDGRYAHLWKGYRPQAEVEADAMTDHDRLISVLDGYTQRKEQISKIAMENCAEAQEAWINCMKHGAWSDQAQLCRHQVRAFEKCYQTQSRFLRALGYGAVADRPAAVDEDIQMHADALYQRVLAHEAAVNKAREEGTPVPVFDPVIPRLATRSTGPRVQPSEEVKKQWDEKLQELPEAERAAEEAALRADLQAKSDVARNMKDFYESRKKQKQEERQEKDVVEGKTVAAQLWSKFTGR